MTLSFALFLCGVVVGGLLRPFRIRVLQTRGDLEAALDHVIRQGQTLPEPQRSRFFAELRKDPPAPEGIGVIVTRGDGGAP